MDSVNLAAFVQEASISIFTVGALVYIVYMFIKYIKEERVESQAIINRQSEAHHNTMKEHAQAFRDVEKEMRVMLTDHIQQSNLALRENTKALEHNARVNEKIMQLK